jgi:hypothetical protein
MRGLDIRKMRPEAQREKNGHGAAAPHKVPLVRGGRQRPPENSVIGAQPHLFALQRSLARRRANPCGQAQDQGNFGRNSPNPGQNVVFSAYIKAPANIINI